MVLKMSVVVMCLWIVILGGLIGGLNLPLIGKASGFQVD